MKMMKTKMMILSLERHSSWTQPRAIRRCLSMIDRTRKQPSEACDPDDVLSYHMNVLLRILYASVIGSIGYDRGILLRFFQ
jgi:hypothetical protein